jgi:hypothetical protein
MEGEDNTGPSGAKIDVRDSLHGAWAQIEEIRAQMKQRSDPNAGVGAEGPTHGPVEGSSPYSDSQDIQRLDYTENGEEVVERDGPVHVPRDDEK